MSETKLRETLQLVKSLPRCSMFEKAEHAIEYALSEERHKMATTRTARNGRMVTATAPSTGIGAPIHAAAADIINALGIWPPTGGNGLPLDAWIIGEQGWNDVLNNNPMNTTFAMVPDHNVNSAGVKEYETLAEGVVATVETLRNGLYPTLLQALLTANATLFFSAAGQKELSLWGTGGDFVHEIYQGVLSIS
jgi:hypothetical protein